LKGGRVVSSERLVDWLWGERPPQGAVKGVQATCCSCGASWVARPSPHDLRDTCSRSRAKRWLGEALALWRGPLAAFGESLLAHGEAARLASLRLLAWEDRVGAELALGQHRALVAELGGPCCRRVSPRTPEGSPIDCIPMGGESSR
jgi:hypothetical protein